MNFDDAITAHTKWKVRLRAFIEGAGEPLEQTKVAADNQCDLGKWIYGEGARYKSHDAYEKLRASHSKFHRCAAQVVGHVCAGRKKEAADALGASGEFSKLSQETIGAIMQMRKTAN